MEYKKDWNTDREFVRVWRCVDVHGYTDLTYEQGGCPEGEYYDWQKIEVVNIWMWKTCCTTTSWQMITKTDEENFGRLTHGGITPSPYDFQVARIAMFSENAIELDGAPWCFLAPKKESLAQVHSISNGL